MADNTNREDLDWDSLSNPVPIDLVDAGFETRAIPLVLPGSRSEMLPRAESEALAEAVEAQPVREATVQMPGHGASEPLGPDAQTLQMPAHSSSLYGGGNGNGGGSGGAVGIDNASGSGGTTFGINWPREEAAIQDEFSRIRANMEAEAEAERKAKAEAEKEEAGQRQRLEQWMENARKRLLKADEDQTPPSARIRIRKDHSPSLYRLAEMQKTIWTDGQAAPQDPAGAGAQAKPPAPLDPMATISVPADQFLTLDAPAQPTMREQALTRQAQQQAAQQAAVQQAAIQQAAKQAVKQAAKQASAATKGETRNALAMHLAPEGARAAEPAAIPGTLGPSEILGSPDNRPENQKGGETAFQPMTREQALTRKVAQLRKVAEGAENTLAIGPGEPPLERSALQYAIAAVVIVAICVLGVALFAATQAGLFDGLENRIPFLKPKVSAPPRPVADPDRSTSASASASAARPTASAPAATLPAAETAPGNQPPPRGNPAATLVREPAPVPAPAVPVHAAPAPVAAARPSPSDASRPWAPVRAAAKPAKSSASALAKAPAKPARPETGRHAASKKPVSPSLAARPDAGDLPAAASAGAPDDGEIPAYAKPRAKTSNLGEIILRASVQAATNIDKENLLEMYNRYALGFPGLSGEVVIGLTVDPSGRVLEGSVVSSSTGVEAFDQELLRKVLDWRLRAFPETRPKFITVPFLFPLQGR